VQNRVGAEDTRIGWGGSGDGGVAVRVFLGGVLDGAGNGHTGGERWPRGAGGGRGTDPPGNGPVKAPTIPPAAASIGLSNIPSTGYSTPAATGVPGRLGPQHRRTPGPLPPRHHPSSVYSDCLRGSSAYHPARLPLDAPRGSLFPAPHHHHLEGSAHRRPHAAVTSVFAKSWPVNSSGIPATLDTA